MKAQKPSPPEYPRELKTLGDHLKKKRLELKLLQAQLADILGIERNTYGFWERNQVFPALEYLPRIVSFLGYVPFEKTDILAERIVLIRRLLGLTQNQMAERLRVNSQTLAGWEKGKRRPLRRFQEDLNTLYESLFPLAEDQ